MWKEKGDVMEKELVYNPSHYNHEGRKECWDEMIEIFGEPAVAIFDVLSAYKYHYRAGSKDGNPADQDMEKIKNYMNHAEKMLEKKDFSVSRYYANYCKIQMEKILNEK